MERPFDLELLNLLVGRAIVEAASVERVRVATTDPGAVAAVALLGSKQLKAVAYGERVHVSAGFRLAMLICCRILADPIRGHRGGVKRDIAGVQRWLQAQGKNSARD